MKLHLPKALLTAVLAACVTPATASEDFESITRGGNFWASAYTFSFVLTNVTTNGNMIAAYWGISTGVLSANGFTISYDENSQTYTLSAGAGKLNNTQINASTSFSNQANGNNTTTTSITGLKAGVLYYIQ